MTRRGVKLVWELRVESRARLLKLERVGNTFYPPEGFHFGNGDVEVSPVVSPYVHPNNAWLDVYDVLTFGLVRCSGVCSHTRFQVSDVDSVRPFVLGVEGL